jgi:hypothetical protein
MTTKTEKAPRALAKGGAPAAKATKLDSLVKLLRRPKGANIDDLMAATGWQAHSVRGALAGSIKKKLKLPLSSEKVDGRRVYKIAKAEA